MKGVRTSHERLQCLLVRTSKEKLNDCEKMKAGRTRNWKQAHLSRPRERDAEEREAGTGPVNKRSRHESVTNADTEKSSTHQSMWLKPQSCAENFPSVQATQCPAAVGREQGHACPVKNPDAAPANAACIQLELDLFLDHTENVGKSKVPILALLMSSCKNKMSCWFSLTAPVTSEMRTDKRGFG